MQISIHHLPSTASSGSRKVRLYLWADGEDIPVGDFLQQLATTNPNQFKRVGALFNRMAEAGRITNSESFKDVEGHKPLFEFKAHQVRIYCFYDEMKLILVEGDIKKSDKSKDRNRQSILRAQRRAEDYWQEKRAGRVEVKE